VRVPDPCAPAPPFRSDARGARARLPAWWRSGRRLAERCPPGLTGDIGALSVKVHAGALTEEGLGDSIVEALLGALGRF